MAIFHYTVKIVGRSKGKSIISASAYLNGDVMKNEETGRISYYTSKKEVVYTSLMMCENAPQEWQNVPAENIRRFQKSVRYKRADNQNAALEKFKLTFQKQRLWNEVLRIEKSSDKKTQKIGVICSIVQIILSIICLIYSAINQENIIMWVLFLCSGILSLSSNISRNNKKEDE